VTHPADLLSAEFDLLADDPQAPISAVDFDRALADGRRTVRTRRRRAGLSGVGAFALAALIAVPMLTAGNAAGPPGTAGGGTDPLSSYGEFGWLPTALTATMYDYGADDHMSITTAYDPSTVGTSDVSTMARLIVWTGVGTDPFAGNNVGTPSQIAILNGSPVEMYVTPSNVHQGVSGGIVKAEPCSTPDTRPAGQGGGSLADQGVTSYGLVSVVWRTASGGAASIDYQYVNQAAPDAADMLHMAETVVFGVTEVPLPLTISGLSAPLFSVQKGRYHDQYPDYLQLQFYEDGVMLQIYVDAPAEALCTTLPIQTASRTLDGLRFEVLIWNTQAVATADLTRFGTAAQILDDITSLGPDPANWTTSVIKP
jgi:hypothetical protein